MTDRQNYVAQLCDQALLRVLSLSPAPSVSSGGFSAAIVENIVDELRKMHSALDPEVFKPSFPRFIIDIEWKGECQEVADLLLEVAYQYDRIRKKGRFRQGVPDT